MDSFEKQYENLKFKLFLILICSVLIFAVVYTVYFYNFNGKLSIEASEWGQFGDYVGGVLNPFLGLLSFLALLMTIAIQVKSVNLSTQELRLSRSELEMTRTELQRSARAQELSEKALKAQAKSAEMSTRLNAINFLLHYYQQELMQYHGSIFIKSDPRKAEFDRLTERESKLTEMLEEVFQEISHLEEEE